MRECFTQFYVAMPVGTAAALNVSAVPTCTKPAAEATKRLT